MREGDYVVLADPDGNKFCVVEKEESQYSFAAARV